MTDMLSADRRTGSARLQLLGSALPVHEHNISGKDRLRILWDNGGQSQCRANGVAPRPGWSWGLGTQGWRGSEGTKALREERGSFPRTLLASPGGKGEWGHPR